jgi:hypothetical protein
MTDTLSWSPSEYGATASGTLGGRAWTWSISATHRSPYNPFVLQLRAGSATWEDGIPFDAAAQARLRALVRRHPPGADHEWCD